MKRLFAFIFIALLGLACKDAPPPTDKNGFLLDREKAEFKGILLGKEVTITESDSTTLNLAGTFAEGNQDGDYISRAKVYLGWITFVFTPVDGSWLNMTEIEHHK